MSLDRSYTEPRALRELREAKELHAALATVHERVANALEMLAVHAARQPLYARQRLRRYCSARRRPQNQPDATSPSTSSDAVREQILPRIIDAFEKAI
jgi:hypothetical protein